ncbi:MAG TPA: hypothetical protein VE861_12650, partial [Gemmatimonadaceae bacterium]|nr:hypothetical protein [Gemmatimonadaceae bacterium]
PADPKQLLITSDQGAIISVNGGETFSSWYNQPTAQFYHVNTDNAFPYRVCGGQQESGSACVASRGPYGRTSLRDWTPVGVEEYGYAVPDPRDPDIVYGGKVTRFDRRTGQVQQVGPMPLREPGYRVVRTAPVVFSPRDSTTLYFASNVLWSTRDGGRNWSQRSPDLTRSASQVPANLGVFAPDDPEKGGHRGVIYAVAPSPRDTRTVWVGTDDGLIHVTSDSGRSWRDVTPSGLVPWSKISVIEASHHDTDVAYAAVNTFRLDDLRPHIYRTNDRGRTWQRVVTGIPDGGIVNVVREDPVRRGLLFAGTERAVFVSRDDGAYWQSLRRNMPATSIRDLVVKDEDLVVATHGRSFWILDGIAALRRAPVIGAPASVALYPSEFAWRVRSNLNTDTPIPQEEAAGRNPPEGVSIDYALPSPAREVAIEIRDAAGIVVRRYASTDTAPSPLADRNIPDYWIRPPVSIATGRGTHRLIWDLRHATSPFAELAYPIAASFGDTPPEPRGPIVPAGVYQVRLIVDGVAIDRPLQVRSDPTSRVAATAGRRRYAQSLALHGALTRAGIAVRRLGAIRTAVVERSKSATGESLVAFTQLDSMLTAVERGSAAASSPAARLPGEFQQLYEQVESSDDVPTTTQERAASVRTARLVQLESGVARLGEVINRRMNPALRRAGLAPIVWPAVPNETGSR